MIPIHDMLIVDVEGYGDVIVQQVFQELSNIHMIYSPFPHLQIYDIYSLIVLCHDDVLILGVNVIKNNVWTCMLALSPLYWLLDMGAYAFKNG